MFSDLNVPVPTLSKQQLAQAASASKKGKGKQDQNIPVSAAFTPAQVAAIENRLDLLVHLGYTVFAFNQTVERKVDPKTFVNTLDALLPQLRKRSGVVYLKRLTIVLDEQSEKGFGLTNGNAALFAPYDLLALVPTTAATFSLACLTHTQPTPLTTHIISLPLTLPRLPFNLKHTLVRAALKNGAVFEINYVGALGGDGDPALTIPSGCESGAGAKRNWWAAAREVVRVTKGKGILVSGGVFSEGDLRAPRDVANLISVLGVSQDVAHDASTKVAQSLVLRAQTRRTYRAVFSEPKVVIPSHTGGTTPPRAGSGESQPKQRPIKMEESTPPKLFANAKKRPLEESPQKGPGPAVQVKKEDGTAGESGARKKKKNKLSQG
ncbi:PHP domain-like protein [Dichomitus squalens LYAD-421 SS1]|uniref:PHP domain-like protein n=1 Tax=Dichomitus squalens (strain LYAD-421) TaxID=732165 RepID=R7T1Y0_DICSQ|nr:PHP domain-like protein [Dichomitus squalens LYAD-421 SS1]EJF61142.1 PHP domain-like protein [Dichomitus squalens LYAD-421 SS1]